MKRISLGTSDFKKIIDNNDYFIDKTLIVKEFIKDSGEIVLIPRPRRFGKTLNMSIVRYFLEKSKEDRRYLFNGLQIADIYKSFSFIETTLEELDKKYFNDILNRRSIISELEISILKLIEYLNSYYNEKVILLIDE